jgi:hypothetical protein
MNGIIITRKSVAKNILKATLSIALLAATPYLGREAYSIGKRVYDRNTEQLINKSLQKGDVAQARQYAEQSSSSELAKLHQVIQQYEDGQKIQREKAEKINAIEQIFQKNLQEHNIKEAQKTLEAFKIDKKIYSEKKTYLESFQQQEDKQKKLQEKAEKINAIEKVFQKNLQEHNIKEAQKTLEAFKIDEKTYSEKKTYLDSLEEQTLLKKVISTSGRDCITASKQYVQFYSRTPYTKKVEETLISCHIGEINELLNKRKSIGDIRTKMLEAEVDIRQHKRKLPTIIKSVEESLEKYMAALTPPVDPKKISLNEIVEVNLKDNDDLSINYQQERNLLIPKSFTGTLIGKADREAYVKINEKINWRSNWGFRQRYPNRNIVAASYTEIMLKRTFDPINEYMLRADMQTLKTLLE